MYASAKRENNHFGFGADNDAEHTSGCVIIRHRTFGRAVPPSGPHAGEEAWLPCAKVLGAARGRPHAFRPGSVVNVSGMSVGSLSGRAVEALHRGAAPAGCQHSTGEGSISSHHRNGGELVWQIGTGYVGCRDERGRFDLARLEDGVASAPVRALEVKLSQGAKPGLGGLLPAAKVSAEIAATPGVPEGRDCVSPSRHAEFDSTDGLLDRVEMLAAETGLPVGIKSAVGDLDFWEELADLMSTTGRGVDFVEPRPGLSSERDRREVAALMAGTAPHGGSAPPAVDRPPGRPLRTAPRTPAAPRPSPRRGTARPRRA